MDQLDVNLSELRVALLERQRAKTSHTPPTMALLNNGLHYNNSIILQTSTEQSAPTPIKPEPARNWFQRLFGV